MVKGSVFSSYRKILQFGVVYLSTLTEGGFYSGMVGQICNADELELWGKISTFAGNNTLCDYWTGARSFTS